jgi:organic radical activating enzyme
MTAKIVEIFHSLQGEGLFLGQETTFVRFLGCNLFCSYCDTLYARDEKRAAEMTLDQVLSAVSLTAKPGQFVSLTGGEPLLWAKFVAGLGPRLRECGLRVYLETNGTLVKEMAVLSDKVDAVAMDIKPPSDCGQQLWDTHREFLELVKDRAFVKLVITSGILPDEVERAAGLVAGVGRGIPLVLQPASGKLAPDMGLVRKYQAAASRQLDDVKIIFQMHKRWGVR